MSTPHQDNLLNSLQEKLDKDNALKERYAKLLMSLNARRKLEQMGTEQVFLKEDNENKLFNEALLAEFSIILTQLNFQFTEECSRNQWDTCLQEIIDFTRSAPAVTIAGERRWIALEASFYFSHFNRARNWEAPSEGDILSQYSIPHFLYLYWQLAKNNNPDICLRSPLHIRKKRFLDLLIECIRARNTNNTGSNNLPTCRSLFKARFLISFKHDADLFLTYHRPTLMSFARNKVENDKEASNFILGIMNLYGISVARNYDTAVKQLTIAAHANNAYAQNALAQDGKNLYHHLQQRQQQRNIGGLADFSKEIEYRMQQFIEWYKKAAENGHPQAQFNLGIFCQAGNFGLQRNEKEAIECWRKAALQGLDAAQYNLGICYLKGTSVIKDVNEAFEWLKRAADQEYALARDILHKLFPEPVASPTTAARPFAPS